MSAFDLTKYETDGQSGWRISENDISIGIYEEGYSVRTDILNFESIVNAINTKSKYLIKYLGFKSDSSAKISYRSNSNICGTINKKLTTLTIQQYIQDFIDSFIICSKCREINTKWTNITDELYISCNLCGNTSAIDTSEYANYYLCSFILGDMKTMPLITSDDKYSFQPEMVKTLNTEDEAIRPFLTGCMNFNDNYRNLTLFFYGFMRNDFSEMLEDIINLIIIFCYRFDGEYELKDNNEWIHYTKSIEFGSYDDVSSVERIERKRVRLRMGNDPFSEYVFNTNFMDVQRIRKFWKIKIDFDDNTEHTMIKLGVASLNKWSVDHDYCMRIGDNTLISVLLLRMKDSDGMICVRLNDEKDMFIEEEINLGYDDSHYLQLTLGQNCTLTLL